MLIENIFFFTSVHLFDYISLGLLIYSNVNVITASVLETAHVLCLDSSQSH